MTPLDEAKLHADRATISPERWIGKIKTSPTYNWKDTEWFKALKALEASKHPVSPPAPAPPPPTPVTPPRSGNRCVYFSNVTSESISEMIQCGVGYTALFSADLNLSGAGKPYYVPADVIAKLKKAGVAVASWCDCSATPYSAAVAMAEQRGLDFAGGQAEDSDQYKQAVAGGCLHIIGNPANLDQETLTSAISRTTAGRLAFIGEMLHPDPSYSAQGVNIGSVCLYVDQDAAHGGYQPMEMWAGLPVSLRAGASIYTGGRMSAQDWALYRSWTKP